MQSSKDLKVCKFGAECSYFKKGDVVHCRAFSHPSSQRPCNFGATCRKLNDTDHCKMFSHPAGAGVVTPPKPITAATRLAKPPKAVQEAAAGGDGWETVAPKPPRPTAEDKAAAAAALEQPPALVEKAGGGWGSSSKPAAAGGAGSWGNSRASAGGAGRGTGASAEKWGSRGGSGGGGMPEPSSFNAEEYFRSKVAREYSIPLELGNHPKNHTFVGEGEQSLRRLLYSYLHYYPVTSKMHLQFAQPDNKVFSVDVECDFSAASIVEADTDAVVDLMRGATTTDGALAEAADSGAIFTWAEGSFKKLNERVFHAHIRIDKNRVKAVNEYHSSTGGSIGGQRALLEAIEYASTFASTRPVFQLLKEAPGPDGDKVELGMMLTTGRLQECDGSPHPTHYLRNNFDFNVIHLTKVRDLKLKAKFRTECVWFPDRLFRVGREFDNSPCAFYKLPVDEDAAAAADDDFFEGQSFYLAGFSDQEAAAWGRDKASMVDRPNLPYLQLVSTLTREHPAGCVQAVTTLNKADASVFRQVGKDGFLQLLTGPKHEPMYLKTKYTPAAPKKHKASYFKQDFEDMMKHVPGDDGSVPVGGAHYTAESPLSWPETAFTPYTLEQFKSCILVHPFLPIVALVTPPALRFATATSTGAASYAHELIHVLKVLLRVVHPEFSAEKQNSSKFGGEVIMYMHAMRALLSKTAAGTGTDKLTEDMKQLSVGGATAVVGCTESETGIPGMDKYPDSFSNNAAAWKDVAAYCWMMPVCFYEFIQFLNAHSSSSAAPESQIDVKAWVKAFEAKGGEFTVVN